MPICYVYTTLSDQQLGPDFEANLTTCIAETLNKPAEKIVVIVSANTRMSTAGEAQPKVLCELHSIAVFSEEKNPSYFQALMKCLTDATKLDPNQITLYFVDIPAHMAKTGL